MGRNLESSYVTTRRPASHIAVPGFGPQRCLPSGSLPVRPGRLSSGGPATHMEIQTEFQAPGSGPAQPWFPGCYRFWELNQHMTFCLPHPPLCI